RGAGRRVGGRDGGDDGRARRQDGGRRGAKAPRRRVSVLRLHAEQGDASLGGDPPPDRRRPRARRGEPGVESGRRKTRISRGGAAGRRYEIADRLDDSERVRELRDLGVVLHRGRGRVLRAGALEIGGRVIGWNELVVAVGTSAKMPPIEGLTRAAAWTSDDVY